MLHNVWDLSISWQDLVRFALTWVFCVALVYFWYWVLSRIGTF
ncbi:hypothetical protein [Actinomadura sp. NTSP31]